MSKIKSMAMNWPVVVFFIATLILTYPVGIGAYLALIPVQEMLPDWVRGDLLPGTISRFAPTIVALAMLALVAGKESLALWWRSILQWRMRWVHVLTIVALIPLAWAFAVMLTLYGESGSAASVNVELQSGGWTVVGRLADYLGEVVYVTLTNGEETGWRFFLLTLLLVRYRLATATFLLSGLWAIWHWPIIAMTGGALDLILSFSVVIVALSFIMSWIYRETGSLLGILILHGVFNATTEYAFERQLPETAQIIAAHEHVAAGWLGLFLGVVALIILATRRALFFGKYEPHETDSWVSKFYSGKADRARGIRSGATSSAEESRPRQFSNNHAKFQIPPGNEVT